MPADLASFALAGALAVSPHCQWSQPGADRFTGDLVQAVDHYADLPPETRARLKAKMASHAYDDRVVITREGIQGLHQSYDPRIKDMHFGSNRVCRDVKRKAWPARRRLEALVYCDDGHCLMVPAACGNLSRITPTASEGPMDIAPAAGPALPAPPVAPGTPGGASTEAEPDALALPLAQSMAEPPAAGAVPPPGDITVIGAPPVDGASGTPYGPPGFYVPPFYVPPIVVVSGGSGPVVPEPPSWLLYLAGIPILVLGARRLKRKGR